jgi:3-hydroxyisobutyrate dehydrogenase
MARRLAEAGHEVHVWARKRSFRKKALPPSFIRAATLADLAGRVDVIVTIVGGPADVEAVMLGPGGILASARPGTIVVDCTTSSPALARRLAALGERHLVSVLDAPVSGGPAAAEQGTLSLMVGGEPRVLETIRPVLSCLGPNVVRHGGPGAGQAAKLTNQVLLAGMMAGLVEAFEMGRRQGLDSASLLASLSTGIGSSPLLHFLWPRLAASDMAPGFAVDYMVKDLQLAVDAGALQEREFPVVSATLRQYRALAERGFGGAGTQTLMLTRGAGWSSTAPDANPRSG